MAKRIVPIIVILALVGYFGYRGWQQKQQEKAQQVFFGTVEAEEVLISTQLAGRVVELNADEGLTTNEGDLLVRIDDTLYAAQLAQARAAVGTAASQNKVINATAGGLDTNLVRVKKLFQSGSATEMQLDELQTHRDVLDAQKKVVGNQVGQALAMVNLAEAQLEYTRIHAPLNGTILRLYIQQGETVFPGSALMTIADLASMEVTIYVPEPMLGKIKVGQKVELTTDSFPDRPFTGAISHIAEQAEFTPKNVQTRDERVRLVYAVTVRVSNPDGVLKIGMPVDARFIQE